MKQLDKLRPSAMDRPYPTASAVPHPKLMVLKGGDHGITARMARDPGTPQGGFRCVYRPTVRALVRPDPADPRLRPFIQALARLIHHDLLRYPTRTP